MRIALLADIHGNDIALEAVLKDIARKGGVDAYWVLGDSVAIGPSPVKVLNLLQALPNIRIVRGNTDRYICTGDRPGPTHDEVVADTSLLHELLEVEGDFSWTQGAITAAGWFDWISNLPMEFREMLPDETTVLGVHASPGKDGGSGIHQDMSEKETQTLLVNCDEDLICLGHTHRPFSIRVKDQQIVNPGSVSNHVGSDVSACYGIIDAGKEGYEVELNRVKYDNQKVIEILEKIKHPARKFIVQHMSGERLVDL